LSIITSFLDYFTRQADTEHRRAILSVVEQNENARLLDVGCGSGEFTLAVADKVGTTQVCGVDIVEKRIAEARSRGIEVFGCDLNETLPFESGSFDIVLANQIIEHLFNTDAFIREIFRIIKVGGYAVVTTPNLAAVHNILYLLVGRQPPTASVSDEYLVATWCPGEKSLDPVRQQPSHRRIFTAGALEELFSHHGFQVEKTVGGEYFPLPTPLARVMSRVDRRHATTILVKARKPDTVPEVETET